MYNEHTITDMKQLHIVITDEMAKVLDTFPNKSDIVREAISMYNEGTRTDTLKSIRVAFSKQAQEMEVLNEKIDRLLSKLNEINY
jgi:Arc/MetJ-type ribon-helix-helix transcriptional regulator